VKEIIKNLKNTFIAGIVLFLPAFVLLAIVQKVYGFMYGFGHKFTELLGLKGVDGLEVAPIITAVLLMVIFYLCGLLVRFSVVTRGKEWIENTVLVYVPNYSKHKAKMMAKLQPGQDLREPVLVEMAGAWKPGFLISTVDEKSTVFLPSTPDTDYGEVWVVDTLNITKLDMTQKELKTALLTSGKGLKFHGLSS